MSDVYPDDSVSQTGNLEERNIRYSKEFEGDQTYETGTSPHHHHHHHPASSGSQPTKEEEATIAERVRSNVREYLQTEEKLKRLLAATRSLRKQKKTLQESIIGDMRTLDVENLDLKKGKLVAKKATPKVPLTKASITSILSRNYTDQEFIKKITTMLYEERDRTEKVSLAHYVNKTK